MRELSLHIIDILQNSVRAGATEVKLSVFADEKADRLTVMVEDNGSGMTEEIAEKATDPFFTTRGTRRMGLGLPMFKQNAERCGGGITIRSKEGVGTTVTADFALSHIDRPPVGDLAGSIVLTATSYPDIRFVFRFSHNGSDYIFDTDEAKKALGGVSIQEPVIVKTLIEMIRANIPAEESYSKRNFRTTNTLSNK